MYTLDRPRLVVGRSRSCEIRLREDTVSRLHAAFIWQGTELVLEDLGSSNGTFVNGERLSGPRSVGAGDAIRFGAMRGSVEPLTAPIPDVEQTAVADAVDYTVGVLPVRPAGLGWRVLALLADTVLFAIGSTIPFAPLLATVLAERFLLAPDVIPPSLQTKALVAGGCGALWVIYSWYYVVHGWARRGGTPGLRLCGLRLIDWKQRVPIGYSRAWLRAGAGLVTIMTFGLGFVLVLFRRDRKALHDLLAGTQVVHRPRKVGAVPHPA